MIAKPRSIPTRPKASPDGGGAVAPADRTSRPSYHHGALREALLAAAIDQIRSRGTEAVSLRAVAQAIGVSPSAAYAHFPDKGALLEAAAVQIEVAFDEQISVAATAAGPDDIAALARLHNAALAYLRFALTEPHLFRHMFGPYCRHHNPEMLLADPFSSGAFGVLHVALDDLQARGLLRPGARDGFDLVAWTSVHGLAFLALDGHLPADVGESLLVRLETLILNERGHDVLRAFRAAGTEPGDHPKAPGA